MVLDLRTYFLHRDRLRLVLDFFCRAWSRMVQYSIWSPIFFSGPRTIARGYMCVLCLCFVCLMSVLCQFYFRFMLLWCQFYHCVWFTSCLFQICVLSVSCTIYDCFTCVLRLCYILSQFHVLLSKCVPIREITALDLWPFWTYLFTSLKPFK